MMYCTLQPKVAIELTRREASIRSATGKANFFRVMGQAEREFRVLSVQGQSKVDRLTCKSTIFSSTYAVHTTSKH
jgi:hypothetical protein